MAVNSKLQRLVKFKSIAGVLASTLMTVACSSSNFASSSGKSPSNISPSIKSASSPKDGVDTQGKTKSPDGTYSDGFFTQGEDDPVKAPRFAMLVNDLKCGMCHIRINGDVASTSSVSDWSEIHVDLSAEKIAGTWYSAKSWTDKASTTKKYNITVTGGVQQNYVGNKVPNKPDTTTPTFPVVNFIAAESRMAGTLTGAGADGSAVTIEKVAIGNTVITGTKESPIIIDGSVLIKGDLVIKGPYKGVGSVYVTGNIYIPGNITATESVFPFPADPAEALIKGAKLVKDKMGDALGLAAAKSIFVADLTTKIYDHSLTPASQKRGALGIDNIYNWYPGGQNAYSSLYEASLDCEKGTLEPLKGFNLIEAYLYAGGSIGGISRRSSWAINGGVITDVVHLLGTVSKSQSLPAGCPTTVSSVHQYPQDGNYINYDYRMSAGLRVLGELAPYFN
jgi:hypothetical protein